MSFCPDCGIDHHAGDREIEAAADREVEIERLRTKRDIEVARITASAAKDISETEAETGTARAEGQVEGMETVLETISGGEPDDGGDPPVIVEAPGPEPETEPGPDVAPPPEEPAAVPRENKGNGWWDGYR